ncbi:MAG: VanW family protein [Lachnospiraceae bacterium]|nr:VanW family protein [Lachnospiraceae bacterium]
MNIRVTGQIHKRISRSLRINQIARVLSLGLLLAVLFLPVRVLAKDYTIKVGGANVGLADGESDGAAKEEAKPGETETVKAEGSSTESLGTSYQTSDAAGSFSGTENEISMDLTSRIADCIFAGPVELSGMNYIEAEKAISDYVNGLAKKQVTLVSVNENKTTMEASALGLSWSNKEILNQALALGKSGNIVARYKMLKDLEHESEVYPVEISFDKNKVRAAVEAEAKKYDITPKNAKVKRENGAFIVLEEGEAGYQITVESSVDKILNGASALKDSDLTVELDVKETNAHSSEEDFLMMTDVLGTFHTSFSSSGADRSGNVRNGTKLINGTMLYPGEQFSVYNAVSPFTEENGYFLAGSYVNGLVVESLGGGICQVSSTLYNAVLRAELQVDERYNHSMIVTYVDLSSDAAIAGTAKDFKFTNNLDNPIYIEGYTTDSKEIYFTIYGVETRPKNRTVSFESVELSRTDPEGVNIVGDSSQPVGSISSQSAHTGYVGELWKIVKVDGVETERIQINKSTYKMVPKTVTVGTKADDAAISEMVRAAIATGDLDTVKSTINNLQAAAAGQPMDLTQMLIPQVPTQATEPSAEEQAAAAAAYAMALAEAQAAAEAELQGE